MFYRFAHVQQQPATVQEKFRDARAQRAREFFSDTFWTCGHRFFPLLDTPPAQIFWPDGQKIILAGRTKNPQTLRER